ARRNILLTLRDRSGSVRQTTLHWHRGSLSNDDILHPARTDEGRPLKRMEGKAAIVPGAARGLGAAIAQRLAEEGARVALTDVLVTEGRRTSDAIPGAIFLEQDVRDEKRWQEVVAEVLQQFGHLDVLVNNAGWVKLNELEKSTLEELRQHERIILEG